jgi:hypothetical protein
MSFVIVVMGFLGPDALGDQAQPASQGLGQHDQRPRGHAGSDGLAVLCRAGILSSHPLFLLGLMFHPHLQLPPFAWNGHWVVMRCQAVSFYSNSLPNASSAAPTGQTSRLMDAT